MKTDSGRLGHARPATTLNIYAHFVPATDRLAADAMGRILSPAQVTSASPGATNPSNAGKDGAEMTASDALPDQ